MYSRPKELTLDTYQLPEMLRTRLEEVILQMKILQLGKVKPFLQRVMDPPSDAIVKLSLDVNVFIFIFSLIHMILIEFYFSFNYIYIISDINLMVI